ncbi:MAG: hypothetical protein ACLRW2_00900 [Parasutterella excrementihominis]
MGFLSALYFSDIRDRYGKTKIAVIGTGGTIVSSGANATQMTGYSITDATFIQL